MPGTGSSREKSVEKQIPVLFIHGQPGLGSDFDHVTARLGPDFRVISPDRPGYGDSGKQPVSMHENAAMLAQLIGESETPAVVVGHSYGGGIALLLAAQSPELVAGLVLAASVGREEHLGTVDHLLAAPVVGEVLVAGGLSAAATVLPLLRAPGRFAPGKAGKWVAASLPDASFTKIATKRSGIWRSVVAEQRFLLREIGDIESVIPELRAPVQVVTGTWDIIVPPVVAATTASSIPGAELVIVPGTGHFLTRDAPAILASAVRKVASYAGLC
jgi:pimeloyl-ACP methyl ester carboxylesterase